jgi:hypothetical protein
MTLHEIEADFIRTAAIDAIGLALNVQHQAGRRPFIAKGIYARLSREKVRSIKQLVIDDLIARRGAAEQRNVLFEAQATSPGATTTSMEKRTSMMKKSSMRAHRSS